MFSGLFFFCADKNLKMNLMQIFGEQEECFVR